jgi:hypothetical protein
MTSPLVEPSEGIFIEVSLDAPTNLSEIAEKNLVDFAWVVEKCKALIDTHWRLHGTKALVIEYNSLCGYQLRALSSVGVIGDDSFAIAIKPKIPAIPVEKILALSQFAGDQRLQIGNQRLAAQINPSEDYGIIDVLAFSLCDSVETIVRNGIFKSAMEVTETSFGPSSGIDIEAAIEVGMVPPPRVLRVQDDFNVPPNRLIISALLFIQESSQNRHVLSECKRLTSVFEDVKELDSEELRSYDSTYFLGIPRPDYARATELSLAILADHLIEFGKTGAIMVSNLLVDMDYVFEVFCSKVLAESLSEKKFEVLLQPEIEHRSIPRMDSRRIVPDIIVAHRESGKRIILDVKNKYSSLASDGKPSVSNSDLFQQHYYASNQAALVSILLYPSAKPSWSFPLPGSEGIEKYDAECAKQSVSPALTKLEIVHDSVRVTFFQVEIDLSGTVKNTVNSMKRLAFFVEYLFRTAS